MVHTHAHTCIYPDTYRTLRNRVTCSIRNDARIKNGRKIDEASNESEYWILKPNHGVKQIGNWMKNIFDLSHSWKYLYLRDRNKYIVGSRGASQLGGSLIGIPLGYKAN